MRTLGFIVLLLLGTGCEKNATEEHAAAAKADPIGHAECAACGMLVGKQPAPRAQVIHRDGTRAYLCSISDLAHYAEAPSPHGKITHTFVEVMADDADAADANTQEQTWVEANQANYVVGVSRSGIMGIPTMTYSSAAAAKSASERLGGEVVAWPQLTTRLLDQPSAHAH